MALSLSSILSTGYSGLQVAQVGMNVVSDNVSNVNTPGYIRKVADQQAVVIGSQGAGVTITDIRSLTNAFLENANRSAQADSGKADIISSLMDQAQSLFGDPSSNTSFFSGLNNIFSAFQTLSVSPTATQKAQALTSVTNFFNSAQNIQSGIQALGSQTDQQISNDVSQVNQLLSQIDSLNTDISHAIIEGKDPTGAQNQQSSLISQLSSLMDVIVTPNSNGGVTVRASDGTPLAGGGAATLSYDTSGPTGQLMVTPVGGQPQAMGSRLNSGELAGLLQLRNNLLPGVSSQLAELVTKTAQQLNTISNAYTAVPPPATLTGRNTGLDLPTAISGFTGKTTVSIVNSAGVLQQRVDIDFGAGTMSVNGGAAASFTPATFLSSLNSALGASGSASFSNGVLSISANGGNRVGVADDPTTPSSKAGRGFSAFFGLNDLVQSSQITNYDTGLKTTDPNGFTPGQTITFQLAGADGSVLKDVTVAVPSGPTMGNLVSALNDPSTGVGLYGSFALDNNGELSFTPASGSGVQLSVVQDSTSRGTNGPSITALFGLGTSQRISAIGSFSVRPDISQNPGNLPMAQFISTATAGSQAYSPGDATGADALSQAGQSLVQFDAAGALSATTLGLSDYAAAVAGSIGSQASAADTNKKNADALASEASNRLTSAEGVNIDEELVQLTTYQQAYSASARMIQAAKDMFDTLMSMVQ